MLKPDWTKLPADILSIILEYVGDPITYVNVQLTCLAMYHRLKMGTNPSQLHWKSRLKQDFPNFNIPEETGQDYLLLYKERFRVRKQKMVSMLNSFNQWFLPSYFRLCNKIRWNRYTLEKFENIPPPPGLLGMTPHAQRLYSIWSSFGDNESLLLLASRHGRRDLLQFFYSDAAKHYTNGKTRNAEGMILLHWAASYGRLEEVQRLTADSNSLNIACNDGKTPLHLACEYGHWAVVDFLLRSKATHLPDSKGMTPLHYAARYGHHKILARLASEDIDFNVCNLAQETALHLAASHGYVESVKVLLSKNIDVNKEQAGQTALELAAAANHHVVVKLLISHPHTKPVKEQTLMTAARRNYHLVFRQLLERPVDQRLLDNMLVDAAIYGRFEVARVVLEKAASANVAVDLGRCLDVAIDKKWLAIVKLLLDKGADVHRMREDGSTPLHTACLSGDIEITREVIQKTTTPDVLDGLGHTALYLAASSGALEIVRLLILQGANPYTLFMSYAPIMITCEHPEIAQCLILLFAADTCNLGLAVDLLDKGISLEWVMLAKVRALVRAKIYGNYEVVTLLNLWILKSSSSEQSLLQQVIEILELPIVRRFAPAQDVFVFSYQIAATLKFTWQSFISNGGNPLLQANFLMKSLLAHERKIPQEKLCFIMKFILPPVDPAKNNVHMINPTAAEAAKRKLGFLSPPGAKKPCQQPRSSQQSKEPSATIRPKQ